MEVGSTVEAARQNIQFITTDNDAVYLRAVRSKIVQQFGDRGEFVFANTGLTGPWGTPFFAYPTARRVRRWQKYAAAPWALISEPNRPDLILIDGRFRAYCALYCIRRLNGFDFELLFDDYIERP